MIYLQDKKSERKKVGKMGQEGEKGWTEGRNVRRKTRDGDR